MTCFRLKKDQVVDASTLLKWRTEHLDGDDVFAPEFLQQIIFVGVHSEDIHLESDTGKLFEDWHTLEIRYAPHLEVGNGPYCIYRGLLRSVWRVYDDRQLAFVQAIWPSPDGDG